MAKHKKMTISITEAYEELRDAYISNQYFPNYFLNEKRDFVCVDNDELRSILDNIVLNVDEPVSNQYAKSISESEPSQFYIQQLQAQLRDKTRIYEHRKYELKLQDYEPVGVQNTKR